MPNTNIQERQNSDCNNFPVTGASEPRRIWKIFPDFIRKKSGTNKKAAPPGLSEPEGLKLTERCRIADTDTETDTKTDDGPGARGLTTTTENKEMLTAKKSLVGSRKSWTYGDSRGESLSRRISGEGETFDEAGDGPRLEREVRELHREHSFPGKFPSGSLSKNEARRRLLSWKRTTTARKNSEKQYQY